MQGGSISQEAQDRLYEAITQRSVGCIVNQEAAEGSQAAGLASRLGAKQGEGNRLEGNVWFLEGITLAGPEFRAFLDKKPGYSEFFSYIELENRIRKTAGLELLDDTSISPARLMEYLLNDPYRRSVVTKESLTVLELEPWAVFELTEEEVLSWLGYTAEEADSAPAIHIVTMTTSELASRTESLTQQYDLIYFGQAKGNFPMDGEWRDYNDWDLFGKIYLHTGDEILLKPMTGSERQEYLPLNSSGQAVYRLPGNDITAEACGKLMDFVSAGYPVLFSEGYYNAALSPSRLEIDASSYMYQFLTAAAEKVQNGNLWELKSLPNASALEPYINMPKPVLEVERQPETLLNQDADGNFYLEYTLRIADEGASSGSADYEICLSVDKNGDGRFSEGGKGLAGSELLSQIEITDSRGSRVAPTEEGDYILRGKERYQIKALLDSSFCGALDWNLTVYRMENRSVTASITGMVKTGLRGETMRLLQVSDGKDLSEDEEFIRLCSELPFELEVDRVTRAQVAGYRYEDFCQYDMVLLAFDPFPDALPRKV